MLLSLTFVSCCGFKYQTWAYTQRAKTSFTRDYIANVCTLFVILQWTLDVDITKSYIQFNNLINILSE